MDPNKMGEGGFPMYEHGIGIDLDASVSVTGYGKFQKDY
jgi:hypothetical protein